MCIVLYMRELSKYALVSLHLLFPSQQRLALPDPNAMLCYPEWIVIFAPQLNVIMLVVQNFVARFDRVWKTIRGRAHARSNSLF